MERRREGDGGRVVGRERMEGGRRKEGERTGREGRGRRRMEAREGEKGREGQERKTEGKGWRETDKQEGQEQEELQVNLKLTGSPNPQAQHHQLQKTNKSALKR